MRNASLTSTATLIRGSTTAGQGSRPERRAASPARRPAPPRAPARRGRQPSEATAARAAAAAPGAPVAAEMRTSETTSRDSTTPRTAPPSAPSVTSTTARSRNCMRRTAGATPWASRSNNSPRSSFNSLTSASQNPTAASSSATSAATPTVSVVPRASGSPASVCSISRREARSRAVYGGLRNPAATRETAPPGTDSHSSPGVPVPGRLASRAVERRLSSAITNPSSDSCASGKRAATPTICAGT